MGDEERLSDFELARLSIAKVGFRVSSELRRGFDRAVETSAKTLQVRRVAVWILSGEPEPNEDLTCLRGFDLETGDFFSGTVLKMSEMPAYAACVRARRVLAADDVLADPRTQELTEHYLRPLGIRSMMDAPIYRAGHVVGIVCHEHVGEPRVWTERERDFGVSVADMLGAMVEQAERIEAEERLSRTSRIEALGQLAAGVAHDFNNVLLGVSLEAEQLARGSEEPAAVRLSSAEIMRHADRGTRLVRQLLTFARSAPSQVVGSPRCDAVWVLQDMQALLRTLLTGPWDVTVELPPGELSVALDRTELEQIVMNLVANARDAMPAGGNVTLSLALHPSGHDVELAVTDTGSGIAAAARSRIFDPFFTTKPPDSGSGLGLSIVFRIVERAQGSIAVQSTEGVGTTFRIRIPRIH